MKKIWTKKLINGSNKLDKVSNRRLKKPIRNISRDSFRYAKIQIMRIKARTKVLKTNPHSGRAVPEFENEKYRELIEGNYRIIYKLVDKEKIDILTIHHAARDLTGRQVE